MATAVNKLLEEMKERLLECEVCKEDFQSPQRLPRVLPCHHAFCGECLQQLCKDDHIDCPLCRRSFIVEGPFPVETTRMALLDLKKIMGDQEDQECEGCSKKAKVTSRCLECEESLCEVCCQAHKLVKATRDHNLVSLAEAAIDPSKLLQLTEKCGKHEEKKLEFYCTECRQPACTSCAVLSHTGHKMVELEAIIKQKRDELQAECQRLEAAISHFKERVKSSAANVETLHNRRSEISDKVREFFSTARQLLSDKEEQILADFVAEVKKDRKILEVQQASDEFLLSEAQASLEFGQRVTTVGLPTQVLSALQEMAKSSDDLKERGSTPAAPLPVYEMDGSLDEQADMVRKEEIISQIGTLVRAGVKKRELTQSNRAPEQNLDDGACGDAGQEPVIVRAKYDFDAIENVELSFKKGDLLKVDVFEQDKWCKATHLPTKRKGLIPGNLVCKADNPPQIQGWWFSLEREKADTMLLLPGSKRGTFLVREGTDKLSYVLCVRDLDKNTGYPCVRHYRILKMDTGALYISPKRTFDSLLALVDHYRANADGLCCKLTDACPTLRPLVHFNEFEVPRGSIKLSEKLFGSFSWEVWKGELYNAVDVAVKTLKPGSNSSEAFLAEAKMLHQLRHQKVVQLMAVCTTSEPICIMTELCINGNMQHFLGQDKGKTVTIPIMIEMASQIAQGMAYLKTQDLVHRDLRAANILVGDNHELKVAGFGLARALQEGGVYVAPTSDEFPIKWTAPEAASVGTFSIKSDVWSFGVLLYEIITFGAEPYPGMSDTDVLKKIALPKPYRMPKPKGPVACPDSYYDIMLKCWARKPEERPTFDYLHTFFDNYFIATESNHKNA